METPLIIFGWLLYSIIAGSFLNHLEIQENTTIPIINFLIFTLVPPLILIALLFYDKGID